MIVVVSVTAVTSMYTRARILRNFGIAILLRRSPTPQLRKLFATSPRSCLGGVACAH